MSNKGQKMLGRFFRLTLTRFSKAPSEDTYVFLVTCEDRLCNLDLVETHGINYTTI